MNKYMNDNYRFVHVHVLGANCPMINPIYQYRKSDIKDGNADISYMNIL